jgi:hypothetical protein
LARQIMTKRGINIFFMAAIANAVVFWLIAAAIGGDALSGSFDGVHYWVVDHGRRTEVSKWVWDYSYVHLILSALWFFISLFVKLFDHRFGSRDGKR